MALGRFPNHVLTFASALSLLAVFGVGSASVLAQQVNPEGSTPKQAAGVPSSPPAAVEQMDQARELFMRGIELADQEQWLRALESFEASSALVPRVSTQFNIANALIHLARFKSAVDLLERIKSENTQDLPAIEQANALIQEASANLATVAIDIHPPQAAATAFIDGVVIEPGDAGQLHETVDPGSHLIRVDATGYQGFSRGITAHIGQYIVLPINLHPDLNYLREQREKEQQENRTSLMRNPWFWTVAGVLVAGVVITVVATSSDDGGSYGGDTGTVLTGLRSNPLVRF